MNDHKTMHFIIAIVLRKLEISIIDFESRDFKLSNAFLNFFLR